jgi:hypothetical protein
MADADYLFQEARNKNLISEPTELFLAPTTIQYGAVV